MENTALFNTPLEIGLRALFLISNSKKGFDLQTLIYYDYFLVHSKDAGGPESIHPSTPLRSGEILVKRTLMQEGLQIMHKKELITVVFENSGIIYSPNKLTKKFLNYCTSEYAKLLDERAKWVNGNFNRYNPEKLKKFVEKNIENWSSEFSAKNEQAKTYDH